MFLERIVFQVEGLNRSHCFKVKEELKRMDSIKKVKVDLENQKVSVFYKKAEEVSIDSVKECIEKLGIVFKGVL